MVQAVPGLPGLPTGDPVSRTAFSWRSRGVFGVPVLYRPVRQLGQCVILFCPAVGMVFLSSSGPLPDARGACQDPW
jgi:hypothetical protein